MKAFNVALVSMFKNRPGAYQCPESVDHQCRNCEFPFLDTEVVRDQLYQMTVLKSLRLGGICSRILRELLNIVAELPLSIY